MVLGARVVCCPVSWLRTEVPEMGMGFVLGGPVDIPVSPQKSRVLAGYRICLRFLVSGMYCLLFVGNLF